MRLLKNLKRRKRERERKRQTEALTWELLRLQSGMQTAVSRFNAAADPALADASILELNAWQSRYCQTLCRLKALYREDRGQA